MSEAGQGRLWGGRFEVPPAQAMVELSRSTHFDWALAPYDIAQGTAHAAALLRAGLLDEPTYSTLVAGPTASKAAYPGPSARNAP